MNPCSQQDQFLFRQAVDNMSPATDEHPLHPQKRQVKRNSDTPAPVGPEDVLFFRCHHLAPKIMNQLKKGLIPFIKTVDLHHLTEQEAKRCLAKHFSASRGGHTLCYLVVHGKGLHSECSYPVLKNTVNIQLRLYPNVLGFCSASPQHGGAGAVYVLVD